MKAQRLAAALTAINLVLLVLILARGLPSTAIAAASSIAQASPPGAPTVVPILRGRILELVDDQDRIRARFNVEPDGEVVFRLVDQKGRIRVKLGAGESGSGLLTAGRNDGARRAKHRQADRHCRDAEDHVRDAERAGRAATSPYAVTEVDSYLQPPLPKLLHVARLGGGPGSSITGGRGDAGRSSVCSGRTRQV